MLAAFVCACQIVGGLVWVQSAAFSNAGYANVLLIASLCISVLVVSRLRIPNPVRAVLVLGSIMVLLGISVRGDLTGVKTVSETVISVLGKPGNDIRQPDEQAVGRAKAKAGAARVELVAGEGGDGGWANRLNNEARARIEGGAPAEIHGNVTLAGGDAARPRIGWSVAWAGATVSCGRLSAVATRPEGLTNQVLGTFQRSLARTAELKRPSCY
ncbi:hypothetical protein P6144_03065 [Sphingomonas sp. HITSZ_GF]|uniref:hypothetical protein n=1 Tax=Sphingomonas sp. HITSZ_GF TaxID=3037247 RepID=UPI00240D2429|nr:hypothetical protein [Sphingomonas sp. HITSZ_GF]MDG2532616.1 hypothetical protein [Sphingomonas sp. HITSZ_GF]